MTTGRKILEQVDAILKADGALDLSECTIVQIADDHLATMKIACHKRARQDLTTEEEDL